MKKIISNIATKDKGRRLKIFATIFAAIFALIALATGLALKNYGGRRTDLTQTTAAATEPTDTSKYWTDEAAWSAAGKDFNNYTLSGSGSQGDPYLIQSEWDLAYLSWTIYTNNPILASHVSSTYYYYSGIYFKQTADLDLSAYYWQPIGITRQRDGWAASRYFSGCYDGGSHTVSGIFTVAGTGSSGLFGTVKGRSSTNLAIISNVGVIDSFVQGSNDVGGVVGGADYATITNCYNTGSVSGGARSVGGVVGSAYYGTVENCYNTGSVSGEDWVGGVVGGGSATNCYNTGLVEGSTGYVGGVVGRGSATNCYNTGSVEGYSDVGGVVGYTSGGTVISCYNIGSVSGSENIGGVVGRAYSSSTVTNCYNTGSVEGHSDVGGVVGNASRSIGSSSGSTVTNCYNTGSVSGEKYVGGVVGPASDSTISNTYYGGDCTLDVGMGSGSGSAVKIDEPVEEWAKNKEWYSANAINSDGSLVWSADSPWDFENAWEFVENAPDCATNNGYLMLQGVGGNSQVIYWTDEAVWSAAGKDFNNYTLSGSGGQDDPYLIQNEWDLAYLSWTIYTKNPIEASHVSSTNYYYSGIYFKQIADLDLSAYYWQPIGIGRLRDGTSAIRSFSGSYDGGSHTVSGVFTPAGKSNGYSYQGLFGHVRGQSSTNLATISNVGVIDSFVQGYDRVGGVVGEAYSSSTVTNCYNTGSVNASSNYVGGVVGYAYRSTVTNCYNTGSVSGLGYVGGVAGRAYGTVTNCYNSGSVSGSSYVGGVVGFASSVTVINCYNTGSVEGSIYVGGVGGSLDGTVENCYNTGSVSGSSQSVGGVAGYAIGTVENCYNTGSVKGSRYVGGVVGDASNSTVTNCYNTGSVEGSDYCVGGVVGDASSSSTVTNCYNTGSVEGSGFYVGGVVGDASSSTVTNCYNTGSVEGSSRAGGVVGYAGSNSTISNTYYGGDRTLDVGIGSGSGSAVKIDEPVEEWAKNQDWYSADAVNSDGSLVWSADSPWDFENTWEFVSIEAPSYVTNNGYPKLKVFGSQVIYWTDEAVWSAAGKNFNNYTLSGSGSQGDPYLIQSEWDLAYLSWTIYTKNPIKASHISSSCYYSGIYFEQTADLDLSAYYWQPIGIVFLRDGTSANRYFSGYYDGGSHTVSGVFTPAGESNGYSYQGLFGFVGGQSSTNKATISNVGVIDSFVQGYNYVGGVVGFVSNNSTVENCYNTGSVSGSRNSVGGVVGSTNINNIIKNCYNTGSVSGSKFAGGVVGYAFISSTVINCYNTGSVSGDEGTGGVVGRANASTVTNCYNTGWVSSSGDRVGGVVGETYNNSSDRGCTITNCYNTGSVSGSRGQVGGVVGRTESIPGGYSSTIENCFNTGSVSGSDSYVGGVVGYASSSTVTNCYNIGSVESSASVGGVVGFVSSVTFTNCGFEGVINGSSSIGAIVGDISHASATISNCYAVAESDSEISLVGSNRGNGTIENIVGVVICGGQVSRMYKGDDFTAFAWLNFDSSPVLEHFTWAGQFQEPPAEYAGNSNWILTKMQSEGWTEILA